MDVTRTSETVHVKKLAARSSVSGSNCFSIKNPEYDASRLMPDDVEAALVRSDIPVLWP